jgi:hypothetical protein
MVSQLFTGTDTPRLLSWHRCDLSIDKFAWHLFSFLKSLAMKTDFRAGVDPGGAENHD